MTFSCRLLFALALYILKTRSSVSSRLTCDKEPIGNLNNHMSVIYRKFAAYQEEKGVYTANLRYNIPHKAY